MPNEINLNPFLTDNEGDGFSSIDPVTMDEYKGGFKPGEVISLIPKWKGSCINIDYAAAYDMLNESLQEGIPPYEMSKIYGTVHAMDGAIGQRRLTSFSDVYYNHIREGAIEFTFDYEGYGETALNLLTFEFRAKVSKVSGVPLTDLKVMEVFPIEGKAYIIVNNKHVALTANSLKLLDKYTMISSVLYTNHDLWYCLFSKSIDRYFAILLPPEIKINSAVSAYAFAWDELSLRISAGKYMRLKDIKCLE